jgi:hypothetical protein
MLLVTAAPFSATLDAQITRHPTGVNVNATNVTSVFITFGNLGGKVPVEASWCGEVEPAMPAIGERCAASTLYGRLPIRYDRSQSSGANGLTDIMTIPASVARRAYQAAVQGEDSRFYYVRRFVDPRGGPDEYVVVTCRLTDGGARTPFSLADVRLAFASGDPVLSAPVGETLPEFSSEVHYTGTGRLRGRWEIVQPGEMLPGDGDLLTEATLPAEQRRTQRRYPEIQRFDVFLPPGGPFTLEGPPPEKLPTDAPGMYLVLLRIEASADKEADSNLGSAGAGSGIVAAGGVAGFTLPPLRYFVGETETVGTASDAFTLLSPADDTPLAAGATIFRWRAHPQASFTRIEIATATDSVLVEAILPREVQAYSAPPLPRLIARAARWRAVALTANGRVIQSTPWRAVRRPPNQGEIR